MCKSGSCHDSEMTYLSVIVLIKICTYVKQRDMLDSRKVLNTGGSLYHVVNKQYGNVGHCKEINTIKTVYGTKEACTYSGHHIPWKCDGRDPRKSQDFRRKLITQTNL